MHVILKSSVEMEIDKLRAKIERWGKKAKMKASAPPFHSKFLVRMSA